MEKSVEKLTGLVEKPIGEREDTTMANTADAEQRVEGETIDGSS